MVNCNKEAFVFYTPNCPKCGATSELVEDQGCMAERMTCDPLPTGTYIVESIDVFQHGEEKFKKTPKSDVYTDTHNDYDTEDK